MKKKAGNPYKNDIAVSFMNTSDIMTKIKNSKA